MDLSQLPSLGVAGALVLVISYLLLANRTDRAQQQTTITDLAVRHAADRAADRAELATLRKRVDDLEAEVDLERDERRRAEDRAAEAGRRAAAAEARADTLVKIVQGRSAGDQPASAYTYRDLGWEPGTGTEGPASP